MMAPKIQNLSATSMWGNSDHRLPKQRFLVVGLGMKNHGFFDSKCCLVQKKLKINKRTFGILWPGTGGRSLETCRTSTEPCLVPILNSV